LAENLEIFEVNATGLFVVTQVFGSEMVKAGRGSIINIGSLYASVSPDARFYEHLQSDPPFLKPPAYGASKAAVVNLTKYLATHWAPHGVRVNTLSPGGVLGGQDEDFKRKFCDRVPLGRMASTDDLRGPLLFLASRASSYVTGIELVVDGGFTAW
jgi:NAD(P)-dependent dehydrogenase (short-subunit alcohol dehydrogenase family)